MALINHLIKNSQSLIFHSDRGIQSAYKEFACELKKYKSILRGILRKGNCCDNALAHNFFKKLKEGLIYRNNYQTRQEAKLSIFGYIKVFYNAK